MLVDLPDYTSANPWQSKTIDTCAPMAVARRIDGNISKVKFLHLGWEDIFLVSAPLRSKLILRPTRLGTKFGIGHEPQDYLDSS